MKKEIITKEGNFLLLWLSQNYFLLGIHPFFFNKKCTKTRDQKSHETVPCIQKESNGGLTYFWSMPAAEGLEVNELDAEVAREDERHVPVHQRHVVRHVVAQVPPQRPHNRVLHLHTTSHGLYEKLWKQQYNSIVRMYMG